ncbi:Toll-like receptor 6 [Amphibalanus amphitrite]|uniref:Toll-like receptor 6 n=1 Tax=Amphibalanus amphitrite TaxID=1232801 RepID=A0A6A4V1G9_AMPAM|nr:toll-like receptor 6 [Amphibalanus amphitrite]KAF0286989.1 Toll-like receptor 6 [Amphibalanus amphitrite]
MRVSTVILALVVVVSAADDYCEPTAKDLLRCSLGTLDSGRVNSTSPSDVKHLEITCTERSYFHEFFDLSFLQRFVSLQSLSITHCKFSTVRPGAFLGFPQLQSLSVRTYNTEWSSEQLLLERGCFEGLRSLETLDLGGNNLWSLEEDVLGGLPALKQLNLTGNKFQALSELQPAGVNDGLQVLDLSNNNLLEVPSTGVRALPALRELYLSGNELAVIHDGALSGLRKLQVLDVSSNQLVALPAMMLNETRQLRELRVQNNSIRVLPPGLLADLPHLLTVNMSSNSLNAQWIRKDTFAGLFRLIVLDLSGNRLDSLSPDVFEDLSSLQVLDLSSNQLQTLPTGLFTSLSNLHTLTLSGNSLNRLEPGFLAGLHVLSRLNLDDNRLAALSPEVFTNVTSIEQLSLAGNELIFFPEAINRLTYLQQLDLSANFIGDIAGETLRPLKHLSYLRLAQNKLTNISAHLLSNQSSLTMLDLSQNEIASIDSGAFDKATNLRAVRLDANRLHNINGLFAKLPSLLWLNVSDNQIEFFDYALIPGELRWLDMHKNQLREIGNFYNRESKMKLETLDLSHNQVSLITSASVPDSIKYFIIAGNQLLTVEPGTFENKYQLIRADLSSNQLSELDLNAVTLPVPEAAEGEDDESVAELLLAGNPFFCDCNMDWLLRVDTMTPKRKFPKVLDGDRVMCRLLHSPNRLTPLRKTKPSDFLCNYERHCFALCHCCNYVACDCEMKCPDGCSCYHDHTWNTNMVDCSSREQVAISREIPMDATAVFADGNNIRSLDSHTFIGRKRIRHLHVNNSNVEEIQNRSLNGLSALQVLRLEDNLISEIHDFEFESLTSLRELYLHNNRLRTIHPSAFSKLRSLEVLTLSGNELTTYPVWQLSANSYLVELALANNPWSCECSFSARLTSFLADNHAKVEDADSVQCEYSGTAPDCSAELANKSVRRADSSRLLPLVLVGISALAVAAVTACLVFRYRACVCARRKAASRKPSYMDAVGVAAVTPDVDKLYDVFVTYSAQDTRFVNEALAPELEHAAPALRLCLLRRDAPNTSYLGDAVHHCVQASRKTLLVVSRNFLDNEWCRFDFKASHLDALRTSRGIVVLLYGVERNAIEGELKTLLKGAPCVTYGEPDFWRKLRGLLPQCRGFKHTLPHSVSEQSYMARVCRDNTLLQSMLQSDSSPTCSTVVSDDRSDDPVHIRSDSNNPLVSNAQPLHNSSYSSIQPSEHTYMTIEQYQTAAGALLSPEADLYSTLEPEVQPQMPSDPAHPSHLHHQRELSHSLWV